MKIRQGFVSNSSSCSFLIYGIYIEESKMIEQFKKNQLKKASPGERAKTLLLNKDEDLEDLDGYDFLNTIMKDAKGFSWDTLEGCDWFVGKSWDLVDDNETGKQFKESVEKTLKDLFGDDIKCSTHNEAWRDS